VTRPAALALALLLAAPSSGAAQQFGARVLWAGVRTAAATPATDLRLTGNALGVEGAFGIKVLALNLRYLEGTLRNDSAGVEREIAEGEATLWLRPFVWGAVGGGPHIRSFVAPGGTERWLLWEVRGRATAPILPPVLHAYLEGWLAVTGDVDIPEPFDSGRGVEGGVEVSLGRLPVSFRLRYRAERVVLGDGARRETTEHVMLGVGLGRL
jgi:hypothetical protein